MCLRSLLKLALQSIYKHLRGLILVTDPQEAQQFGHNKANNVYSPASSRHTRRDDMGQEPSLICIKCALRAGNSNIPGNRATGWRRAILYSFQYEEVKVESLKLRCAFSSFFKTRKTQIYGPGAFSGRHCMLFKSR